MVARNGRTNSCCPAFNNKNFPAFNDKNLLSITAHNNAPNAYYNVGREDIVRNYYVLGQRADSTYMGVVYRKHYWPSRLHRWWVR